MTKVWIFILSILIGVKAFSGGTVVGNGGDPLFEFLEATRASMIETLKVIDNDPAEKSNFCHLASLSDQQVVFCHDYFLKVVPAMLLLSQGKSQTLFVLRDQPLYVEGPDGQPMVVAARTQLGPAGPIEISRESIKLMPPTQLLFLISHEFQHKSNYTGFYVDDNSQIGPFATGRDLIDSVATSIVAVARRKGKIGSQFGIRDLFDCRVSANGSQFGARIASPRVFTNEALTSYETTFGRSSTDGTVYLPEDLSTSIKLRIEISEPNNCEVESYGRKTLATIVRSTTLSDGSFDETVLAQLASTTNPMCPQSKTSIEIGWQEINFDCIYFGSSGTTSSQAPLSGKNQKQSQLRGAKPVGTATQGWP